MRRRTGAAGIAVAIAAIVPLADPAPAQDLTASLEPDCRSFTYQEAVPIGLEEDPGKDPLCADEGYEDPSGEAPPDEEGRTDDGRLDPGGADDGRLDGGLPDGSGPGQVRPDGNGPDGGGPGRTRPDEGRLDEGRLDQDRPGQSHSAGQGPFDQGGIREIREADDGAGGATRPDRDQLPTISATSVPRPATTAPAPAPVVTTPAPVASPAVTPTLGTQGGLGGASGTGPSDWDIGIGLSFVTGAALAAGYVIRRRRRV
ncbi:hypothetical protein C4J65_03455 [Streptomyces sp. CB09001]|uniref:hypothetical protein n=1 Tax=unclassified Streptomyces TaxID=2593676 RepID=UPI000E210241|nr:hypothetical protein [Streptomyces sp. CB09001]AXL87475.1 hypothetical protein C4J65_03455 [Streptomyces sp. CB09001]